MILKLVVVEPCDQGFILSFHFDLGFCDEKAIFNYCDCVVWFEHLGDSASRAVANEYGG
jgi:hypothetical protein